VQHYYALLSDAAVDLYQSRADAAYAAVHERWAAMEDALLFRIQFIRITMHELRARIALARASGYEPGPARKCLLADAARDVRTLEQEHTPWSDAMAHMLKAGIAALAGDASGERAELLAASEGFDVAEMGLHAALARRCLGERFPGQDTAALLAPAEQWMRQQGIVKPERMGKMLAPVHFTRA
jgi:hypothetical protein